MKKLILAGLLLMGFTGSFAQKSAWIDVGLKGAFSNTWLLNNNITETKYSGYDFSFGNFGGVKLGLNFNESVEVTADFLYSKLTQKYLSSGVNPSWSRNVSLNYLDIPLLFRSNKDGTYIEIGPQVSFLMNARDQYTSGGGSTADYNHTNAKQDFAKNNFSAVFGFGSYIVGTDNFYVCMGLRFTYGISDLVSKDGSLGKDYVYTKPDQTVDVSPYSATHSLTGAVILELNYDLGYIAKAHCRRRQVMFFD